MSGNNLNKGNCNIKRICRCSEIISKQALATKESKSTHSDMK